MQKQGLAPWTIRSVLTPLGRILGHAVRRGLINSNPMQGSSAANGRPWGGARCGSSPARRSAGYSTRPPTGIAP